MNYHKPARLIHSDFPHISLCSHHVQRPNINVHLWQVSPLYSCYYYLLCTILRWFYHTLFREIGAQNCTSNTMGDVLGEKHENLVWGDWQYCHWHYKLHGPSMSLFPCCKCTTGYDTFPHVVLPVHDLFAQCNEGNIMIPCSGGRLSCQQSNMQ